MPEIVRLSFPEYAGRTDGVACKPEYTGQDLAWAWQLLNDNREHVRILPEGEYNLTPKNWTANEFRHDLLVLPNGRAARRTIPLYPDSALRDDIELPGFGSRLTVLRLGGQILRIPEDAKLFGIAAHSVGMFKQKRLYEIVAQVEGEFLEGLQTHTNS